MFRPKPSGRRSSAGPEPRNGSTSFTFCLRLIPPIPPPAAAGLAERARVFVTIATAASLPPVERLKNIYPRYTAPDPSPAPAGLSVFGFRDGTPYQGEDLAFDPAAPERFLARCARTINRLTPGTCLYERRVGEADI